MNTALSVGCAVAGLILFVWAIAISVKIHEQMTGKR